MTIVDNNNIINIIINIIILLFYSYLYISKMEKDFYSLFIIIQMKENNHLN